MRTKDAILGTLKDARGWLDAWSAGFTERQAHSSRGALVHPLAWHLGHVASTQDDVIRLFSRDGRGVVPESLRAVCGNGCPAPTARTRYPSLRALRGYLKRTQAALTRLVATSTDKGLDRPPRTANPYFRSLGQAVYEIALHEMYHVGALAPLRRAWKLPSMG
jgi:hypothetical protein